MTTSRSRTKRPAPGQKPARQGASSRPGHARPAASRPPSEGGWLYGRHAVAAALANEARALRRLVATEAALAWLGAAGANPGLLARATKASPAEIDALLPPGAVHQGVALEADPLARARLKEVCGRPGPHDRVVVLDQITDPQNIGAVFRSAAAFGALGVVVHERRTPPIDGALAKAAAGAIETTPCIAAVNIARALEALKGLGFHCAGLAGDAPAPISALPPDMPIAIVLGAEGEGLRPLVRATCDAIYRIPIAREVESLNVSNAAAIALYETARRAPPA